MKKLQTLFALAALLNFCACDERCLADGNEIAGRNGNVFMQEDNGDNKSAVPAVVGGNASDSQAASGSAAAQTPKQGAEIVGQDGNLFMEETTHPPRNSAPPVQRRPVRIITHNYSNVGVATDPSGNIIPQINRTGQSVQPLGSTFDAYNEMAPAPVPSYAPGQLINIPGYAQPVMPYGVGMVPVGPSANFRVGGMNIGIGPTFQAAPIVAPLGPGGPVLMPYPGLLGSPYNRSSSYSSTTTIIAPPGGAPINGSGQ